MEIRVNTGQMRDVVNRIIHAVEARAELDAFRDISVKVSRDKMYLGAMMPGIDACEFFPLEDKTPPIKTGLPAKTLQSILSTVQTETLILKITEKQVQVVAGKSKFRLLRKPEQDVLFPDLTFKNKEMLPFDTEAFCRAVRKVSVATVRDGNRPYFSVINFNKEHAVATDGRILCLCKSPFPDIEEDVNLNADHLLKMVKGMHKIGGEGRYAFDEHKVYFEVGNLRVALSAMSLAYPNYRGLVTNRADGKPRTKIPRDRFVHAVHQVAILSTTEEKIRAVDLSFTPDGIYLSARTGIGDSEAFLGCPSAHYPEDDLRFDVDLLLKGVNSLEQDEISFLAEEAKRPALFEESDYAFFINPLRTLC